MAGIYLHIPFCRKACVYCDFHFSTSLGKKSEMVKAIELEIGQQQDFFQEKNSHINTIYFGGGTPSLLSVDELAGLLAQIRQHFHVAPAAEITLEANPDDLHPDFLMGLKSIGFNRLSIGTQSFRESDLQWMNRSHHADQAIQCVKDAQQAGFDNLTIDVIFGLPDTDLAQWQWQLEQAIALNVPHLSLYALTVEEKTALAHQVQKDLVDLPEDEAYEEQFMFAHDFLQKAGYEHYELSNYAFPGKRSRHNSAYWDGVPYLGLGPSAHSFDGEKRYWNHAHNARYLKLIQSGSVQESEELLSREDRYHEYVMTGLRTARGIDIDQIEGELFPDWENHFAADINRMLVEGYMLRENQQLRFTPKGWIISDRLIESFFI
ncbi:MAG: radical SAM family heme chaperone HemW [Bacteroidota bacterium]